MIRIGLELTILRETGGEPGEPPPAIPGEGGPGHAQVEHAPDYQPPELQIGFSRQEEL